MKRILPIFFTALLISSITTVAGFSDVLPDAWYYDDITALNVSGVVDGYSDGRFHPDDNITIAQFLKLVIQLTCPSAVQAYTQDDWHKAYYEAALDKNILLDGEFTNTDRPITRYEAAFILSRTAIYALNEGFPNKDGIAEYINDYNQISPTYRFYVVDAYARGLLQGDESRNFRGADSLTRAQASVVVIRLTDKSQRLSVDFSKKLPVDDSWFSSSVFVGDSLTQGLSLFSGLSTPSYLCYQSVSLRNFNTYCCIEDGTKTIMQALNGIKCSKVFFMLGMNDCGSSADDFITRYAGILDNIADAQPDADIYLESITPVSADKSASGSINNSNISKLNESIRSLAGDRGYFYLDVYTALADDNGNLPEDYIGFDGAHLSTAGYKAWADYLRQAVA